MNRFRTFIVTIFYVASLMGSSFLIHPIHSDSSPWTREKAEHLAKSTLFYAEPSLVESLYQAGSAQAAVDILFPSREGPDKSVYQGLLDAFTSTGFNWDNQNHASQLYQMKYLLDPYEAKRKLFSLFEDIYSVNQNSKISYKDIVDQQNLIYENMFGSYQALVKKLLYNNGQPGDYAQGEFLNLLNQKNPNSPNENYARELLQLFLMGEYKPFESKEQRNIRNYEESDVRVLSRLLTGLMADQTITHQVSYDPAFHFTGSVSFLTGALPIGYNPPFYDSAAGIIYSKDLDISYNGNNGLTDNIIEYIFAKRSEQIAQFLAYRIYTYYVGDSPTKPEIDTISALILSNNFDIYTSVKSILTFDLMYTSSIIQSPRYKNPLELYIGTIKKLRGKEISILSQEKNLQSPAILMRLNWVPFFPGSVFGRDGFDDSMKWNNTSIQNGWMTVVNNLAYQDPSQPGYIDMRKYLPQFRNVLTNEKVPIVTHEWNSYSGKLQVLSGTYILEGIGITQISENLIAPTAYQMDIQDIVPYKNTSGGENFSFPDVIDFGRSIESLLVSDDSISDPTALPGSGTFEQQITSGGEILSTESLSESGSPIRQTTVNSGAIETIDQQAIAGTGVRSEEVGSQEYIAQEQVVGDSLDRENTNNLTLTIENTSTLSEGDVGSQSINIIGNQNNVTLGETISGTTHSLDTSITGSVDTVSSQGDHTVSTEEVTMTNNSGQSLQESSTKSLGVTTQDETIIVPTSLSISSNILVNLPGFTIDTSSGRISVLSGTYDAATKRLQIFSGSIKLGNTVQYISSGSVEFTSDSYLIADVITPEVIYDTLENFILDGKRLPTGVRSEVINFIQYNDSGSLLPIAPTNTGYLDDIIRGTVSFLLSQPEYVLLRGADSPTVVDSSEQRFLDAIPGKLIFIELYGGNDHLSSIIPKDDYDDYVKFRTTSDGKTIALSGTGLIDIGDYYMNSFLGQSADGTPTFKKLYDEGYMRIFNRIGGFQHAGDHSAAAYQISSYQNTSDPEAVGVFGHMIEKEFNSANTISLGARLPGVYRGGRFVNMGGDIVIRNTLYPRKTRHIALQSRIAKTRSYPGSMGDMFRNAVSIGDTGKLSESLGGPSGASGNMRSTFSFLKNLIDNDIGRVYYMGGRGGFDTHDNQYDYLNDLLRSNAESITEFFNQYIGKEDITIVIFSEFGRTVRVNGGLGTDHGNGGGAFVISTNSKLLNELPQKVYGNMKIKHNTGLLGVGIDYRSMYGKIFESIYSVDGPTYFGDPKVSLENDIKTDPNEIALKNFSYRAFNRESFQMVGTFSVKGVNYDTGKSGYTQFRMGTGSDSLSKIYIGEPYSPVNGYYQYRFAKNLTQPQEYIIESYSNQYSPTLLTGSIKGTTFPIFVDRSPYISHSGSSIVQQFTDSSVPRQFSGSGFILNESTTPKNLNLSNQNLEIHFPTGLMSATGMTTAIIEETVWYGGFTLGESVKIDEFYSQNSRILPENLPLAKNSITRINKLGPDKIGFGMNLNRPLAISFTNITGTGNYRVLLSSDGILWRDVEGNKKTYSVDQDGKVTFSTSQIAYFALMNDSILPPPLPPPPLPIPPSPSCTITANPSTVTNGSGTLLTWNITNASTGTVTPGNIGVNSTGSLTVIPPSSTNTQYILSGTGLGGGYICSVSVIASTGSRIPPMVLPSLIGAGGGGGGISIFLNRNTHTSITPNKEKFGETPRDTGVNFAVIQDYISNIEENNDPEIDPTPRIAIAIWENILNSSGDIAKNKRDVLQYILERRNVATGQPRISFNKLISYIRSLEVPLSRYDSGESLPDKTKDRSIDTENKQRNMPSQERRDDRINQDIISGGLDEKIYRYISVENTVNVRTTPILSELNIMRSIPRNTQVELLGVTDDWALIKDENGEGYVKKKFLRNELPSDMLRSSKTLINIEQEQAEVIARRSLNIRNKPSMDGKIIGTLSKGDIVIILDRVGKWVEILKGEYRGFVLGKFLKLK